MADSQINGPKENNWRRFFVVVVEVFFKSRLRFQRFISSMKGSHKTKASKHVVWLKIRQKSEGMSEYIY